MNDLTIFVEWMESLSAWLESRWNSDTGKLVDYRLYKAFGH